MSLQSLAARALVLHSFFCFAASFALAARGDSGSVTRIDPPASAPPLAQVLYDDAGDGWIWARGATYKAGFARTGAVYAPFLGSDAPRDYPVTFRVASVSLGGEVIAFAPSVDAVRTGDSVRFERGGLTEIYDLAPGSIEQRFVFARLPHSARRAAGDLVLRLETATELSGRASDGGIAFENERGSVRYGRATAIDASGASVSAATLLTADGIEIRVPADFVSKARMPLTIDPVVSTFSVDHGLSDSYLPDVAYDPATGVFVTVFEEAFSANDHDVAYRLHDASGTILAAGFIDLTIFNYWAHPSVANNAFTSKFLVAAEVGLPSSGTRTINGRIVNAVMPTLGPSFLISTPEQSGEKINPRVGGDPSVTFTNFAVVWERALIPGNHDIHYRLITTTGGLVGGGTQAVENSLAAVDIHPSISKSNNGSAWNVAWERNSGIRAARIDPSGALVTPPFVVLSSPLVFAHDPVASSSLTGTNTWAVSYWVAGVPIGTTFAGVIALDGSTIIDGVGLGDLETLAGAPSLSKTMVHVDSDGEAFAVAYVANPSGNSNVYAATLALVGSKLTLSEGFQVVGASSMNDTDPSIVSFTSSGAPSRRSIIVWDNAGTSSGALSDIHAALYDSGLYSSYCHPGFVTAGACPCGNAPSAYGRGCNNSQNTGGAMLSLSGLSSLASDTLHLSATQVKSNALSVFNQGDAVLGSALTFGQGLRCVGGSLKRLYTKPADAAGAVDAPLSGDPSVHARSAALGDPISMGTTRSYYVYYRDPVVLGGCPSTSTFNTTQSVQAIWIP
jgi:hypothetical protein